MVIELYRDETGVLILEDIWNINWTSSLLELIDREIGTVTVHDMRGKQLTPFLRNNWKDGLDVIVVEKSLDKRIRLL